MDFQISNSIMKIFFFTCITICLASDHAFTQAIQDTGKIQEPAEENADADETNEKENLRKKLFDDQFTSPLSKLMPLRYPPVSDLGSLHSLIRKYEFDLDHFEIAYHRIEILSASQEGKILVLVYKYENQVDTAFAFYKPAVRSNDKKVAFNIIPGSGTNQSGAMFFNSRRNYQKEIDDLAEQYGDVFILVKPNEDFLAIHNGRQKISSISFTNYLLNKGSSYSAYYLIQSLALSKFIKFEYEELIVCGISQGGMAALINSLQCNPQKAIIASGFSVLFDEPQRSGHDQIIIPGLNKIYDSKGIRRQLQESPTRFLFTWGLKEPGVYGIEAREKLSVGFFDTLQNVTTHIHAKGHVYDLPAITEFLNEKY